MPSRVLPPGATGRAAPVERQVAKAPAPAAADPQRAWAARNVKHLADRSPTPSVEPRSLSLGDTELGIAPDGSLTVKGQPTASPEEWIAAARTAVGEGARVSSLGSVFEAVTDPAALRAIATKAALMHRALMLEPSDEAGKLQRRSGRAAALSLIEAAALRANDLGDTDVRDALTFGLMSAAVEEPHRPMRDFTFDRLTRGAEHQHLPPIGEAKEALYPSKPPYDAWLKDGVVRVMQYTDNDGALRVGQIAIYDSLGFERQSNADGSVTMKRPAKDGKPAIEVILAPTPKAGKTPALFEKMNDPSTDVVIYSGHAGYGRRVEQALAAGVAGSGKDKLVMLLQCNGTNSIQEVQKTFPDAHLISSTSDTNHSYDAVMIEELVASIDGRRSYEQMREGAVTNFDGWKRRNLKTLHPSDAAFTEARPMAKQYFYPSDTFLIRRARDRDTDGTLDPEDVTFSVVYPKKIDASEGYDPIDPGAPLDLLDGRSLVSATNDLNLIAQQSVFPPGLLDGVPWHDKVFTPAGFFQPARNEKRAFRFELDGDSIRVQMSAHFAHSTPAAMARMLALEAGQFLGKTKGLDPTLTATLGASFLERAIHQEGSMRNAERDRALVSRYALPFTVEQLLEHSGNPDDFTEDTFTRLRGAVEATPRAAEALSNLAFRNVAPQVPFTPGVQLRGRQEGDDLQAAVRQLGLGARVEANHAPVWFTSAGRTTLTLEGGRRIHVALDSDYVVRAVTETY